MRRLLVIVACLALPIPMLAQTSSLRVQFWQEAASLDEARSYTYRLYVDGSATGSVIPATCYAAATLPTGPFQCRTLTGWMPASARTVALSATNAAGLESPQSATVMLP